MDKDYIPAAKYHILTPVFDFFCSILGLGKRYRGWIIREMGIQNEKINVLDAGCGTGSLINELKTKNPNLEIQGIDPDERSLAISKEKTKTKGLEIKYLKAFIENLPFKDNSFEIVYSSLVFHHIPSKIKPEAAKEIYRVTKHEGKFYLIDFGKPKSKLAGVYSWFTVVFEEGLDNYNGNIHKILQSAGFSQVRIKSDYRYNISIIEAIK